MRLHELAKEIGAESKALLKLAKELGLKIRNHSSNLAAGEIAILKAAHREECGESEAAAGEGAQGSATASPTRKKRRRKKKAAAQPAEEPDVGSGFEQGTEPDADSGFEPGVEVDPAAAEVTAGLDSEQGIAVDSEQPIQVEGDSPEGSDGAPVAVSETADSGSATESDELSPAAQKDVAGAPGDPKAAAPGSAPGRGKVLQVPTPRRRAPSGARIVGKIELPAEEINKSRGPRPPPSTTTRRPGAFHDPLSAETELPATGRFGRSGSATEKDLAERRKSAGRSRADSGAWNPEEEDDPLLQGIRVRNAQTGPHTRRPPRRVGPRRSGRRVAAPAPTGPVDIQVPVSVRELSLALGVKASNILRILMKLGAVAHVNMTLDEEQVLEIASAVEREVNLSARKDKEDLFLDEVQQSEDQRTQRAEQSEQSGEQTARPPRAPVVAFLGHVDHGKTSLLDRIRTANVAAGEAGGITQSMRAYSVDSPGGGKITFLDTPGHKAFTEMRARGANTTDIVVLVVAADDGVMPQTSEAIQHARAADVPIVVALNKIDRHEADPGRVLQQLAQAEVMVEGWGGEIQVAKVSATTGEGMDDLLEKITLQAEIMDLHADPDREARGTVIESRKDDQLGAVATVLIQEGTLKTGDVVLSGTAYGRARMLFDDQGGKIDSAGPSIPVNIVGLNEAPKASETFYVVESLRQARDVAEERRHKARQERVSGPAPAGSITLENLFANLEAGKAEEVKVVLRCDVQGSLEVLKRSLLDLETAEVKVKTVREALGGITEDDVLLALASHGVVIGFNVIADDKARRKADETGVEIRVYEVIYQLIDDMKAAMEGVLSPLQIDVVVGHVEIREVFKVSKLGSVAGCRVMDGVIRRNSVVRLSRDGRVIHTGKLDSLKRFKDDAREVKEGLECGLKLSGYDDIKAGDVVEVVEVKEEKRTLEFDE